MSILATINSLQQKPERIRKRMLVVSVTLVMAIILALWFLNLQRTLTRTPSEESSRNASLITPFASIGEAFRSVYGER